MARIKIVMSERKRAWEDALKLMVVEKEESLDRKVIEYKLTQFQRDKNRSNAVQAVEHTKNKEVSVIPTDSNTVS